MIFIGINILVGLVFLVHQILFLVPVWLGKYILGECIIACVSIFFYGVFVDY